MKTNIPIYRAKSNERKDIYVTGFLIGVDEETNLCTIRTEDDYIGGEVCYLHTLEISDSHKFRKLSECNFRTDYEMDMNSYNGYLDGWNNALKENGKPPHKVYEMIKANK